MAAETTSSITDEIRRLFEAGGGSAYFGEPVTQQEHALQTAQLAQMDDSSDALVVAALLHDIGHLLHDQGEHAADLGIDARHELLGQNWLSAFFGPEVTEPVRLHVAAKRYLCAVDADYLSALSPASRQSLELQGGSFTEAECRGFEALSHHIDAVKLRCWDDQAKIVGLSVSDLESYMNRIEAAARAFRGGDDTDYHP